jgi:hypothetical protein
VIGLKGQREAAKDWSQPLRFEERRAVAAETCRQLAPGRVTCIALKRDMLSAVDVAPVKRSDR